MIAHIYICCFLSIDKKKKESISFHQREYKIVQLKNNGYYKVYLFKMRLSSLCIIILCVKNIDNLTHINFLLIILGLFFIPVLDCTRTFLSRFHQISNIHLFHFKYQKCTLIQL